MYNFMLSNKELMVIKKTHDFSNRWIIFLNSALTFRGVDFLISQKLFLSLNISEKVYSHKLWIFLYTAILLLWLNLKNTKLKLIY